MEHSKRKHALLSASGAKRWLNCPPSARLEDEIEDEGSSFYAKEGTAGHEYGETELLYFINEISKKEYQNRLKKIKSTEYHNKEMDDAIGRYVEIVTEKINALPKDGLVMIEERIDYSNWVPEGFGTGDVVLIGDGVIEVIDLKYGKGILVSAIENPQMRLYSLGALHNYDMLYDFHTVRSTVVQPRRHNVSTEELSREELLTWADQEVKPKADLAFNGNGEFKPGEHCKWCKIKGECRKRAEVNLQMAEYDFVKPDTLSTEEIAEILKQTDQLQKWAKDVENFALDQAENHGVVFPGWKLVEGRSRRYYTDDDEIKELLLANGYKEEDINKEPKLKGIGKMTKLLGTKKFKEMLEDNGLVIKPQGKPTLASEDDKRPAFNSLDQAKEDFNGDS